EILFSVHLALDLEDAEGGPGVYGRVHIFKVPFVPVPVRDAHKVRGPGGSYAGSCPLGWRYHSLLNKSSCFLAKSGSIMASTMQWKAVSHVANQGYSHESGMDRISSQYMCLHAPLRIF